MALSPLSRPKTRAGLSDLLKWLSGSTCTSAPTENRQESKQASSNRVVVKAKLMMGKGMALTLRPRSRPRLSQHLLPFPVTLPHLSNFPPSPTPDAPYTPPPPPTLPPGPKSAQGLATSSASPALPTLRLRSEEQTVILHDDDVEGSLRHALASIVQG